MRKQRELFLTLTVEECKKLWHRARIYSMTINGKILPQSVLPMKLRYVGKDAPHQVYVVDENKGVSNVR